MKRLRISRLMDEYTDTEFFPAGGVAVSPERVKARVLAQAKAAAPARRKQKMPRKKKILLAAALAAALVVLAGAGFPYIQHHLVGGTLSFEQTGDGRITSFVHNSEIVSCEDGRLIFHQDDERVDITDLVSTETPYIYDGSDPDNEKIYYIVIGGTPEAYGWLEWVQVPYPFDDSNSDVYYAFDFDENGNPVMIIYDFEFIDGVAGMGYGGIRLDDITPPQWLLAAVEELDIPVRESPEFE